jgi:hypothetical protein
MAFCRLDVLRQIVGRIPQNPLWAELLWDRHQEAKREQEANLAADGGR